MTVTINGKMETVSGNRWLVRSYHSVDARIQVITQSGTDPGKTLVENGQTISLSSSAIVELEVTL